MISPMRQLFSVLAILLLAAAPSVRADVDHYKEGQRLFAEKQIEAALAEFQQADTVAPNEPLVYSWLAACLNELGRHAEAKQRIEAAIGLLKEAQNQAIEQKQPPPPIALGYYTLLARIQANLGEFEQAAATIASYSFQDDGGEEATKTKQALEAARQALKGKLVALGVEGLVSGDLECARSKFTRADAISPAT